MKVTTDKVFIYILFFLCISGMVSPDSLDVLMYTRYKDEIISVASQTSQLARSDRPSLDVERLYMLIREQRPLRVLDVCNNDRYVTLWLLIALNKNNKGSLTTISDNHSNNIPTSLLLEPATQWKNIQIGGNGQTIKSALRHLSNVSFDRVIFHSSCSSRRVGSMSRYIDDVVTDQLYQNKISPNAQYFHFSMHLTTRSAHKQIKFLKKWLWKVRRLHPTIVSSFGRSPANGMQKYRDLVALRDSVFAGNSSVSPWTGGGSHNHTPSNSSSNSSSSYFVSAAGAARLTIITPCSRPHKLKEVMKSISFDHVQQWIIVHDLRRQPHATAVFPPSDHQSTSSISTSTSLQPLIRDRSREEADHGHGRRLALSSSFAGRVRRTRGRISGRSRRGPRDRPASVTSKIVELFVNASHGAWGNPQRNFALSWLPNSTSTLLYFLDDDNYIHPSLWGVLARTPLDGIATFDIAFPQGGTLPGDTCRRGHLDSAMFLVGRSLVADIRWDATDYSADGGFIERVCRAHLSKGFTYFPFIASYTNGQANAQATAHFS